MTDERVVDASVAMKWLFDEAMSDAATSLAGSDALILAPRLILVEVGNGVWKNLRRAIIDIEAAVTLVAKLPGFFHDLVDERDLMGDALRIAHALDHPIHDCVYLALARRRGCQLVTADERLLARARGTGFAGRVTPLGDFAT